MSTADAKTPTDLDATFERAMKLSPEQRLELSERLLLSVPPFPDKDSEAALAKTVERRIREVEDGKVQMIPGDEAFATVRDSLKKMREDQHAQ